MSTGAGQTPPDDAAPWPVLADVLAARRVLRGVADATPMIPSAHFTRLAGQPFWLKLETMQPIGAFKLRGALNAVAALPADVAGVTCCSTGNHGRAVAWAARQRGLRAVICMSSLVPEVKRAGVRALGAELMICGRSQDEAMAASAALEAQEGLAGISPFDDPHVVAGQGTIGLEMLEAVPDLDMLLVPLSGGGLAAGVAMAAKAVRPQIRVIGISMERGAAMAASIAAGHPVELREEPSLADSLGGGIGLQNRLSFPMCRALLDDVILVSEEAIYGAMQALYYEDGIVAEGACVVGLAALAGGLLPPARGPVAAIITGRNLDMGLHAQVMAGQDVDLGGGYLVKGSIYGA